MTDSSPPPPSWPDAGSPGGSSGGSSHPPPPPPAPDAPGTVDARGPGADGDDTRATPGTDWSTPDAQWDGSLADLPPPRTDAEPPPPRRRRIGLVLSLVAVAVLALGGVFAALLAGSSEPEATSSVSPPEPTGTADAAPPGAAPDDGDLSPAAARAHRELFTAIETSEGEMIALSTATPVSTQDLDEAGLAAFEETATEHVAELERVHDQLEALDTAGDEDVTAIRDAYLAHLEDWIDWGRAVAADPTLVDRPEAAGPYFDAINFSADGFSTAVASNLDRESAPSDVVDLADGIIRQGFSTAEDDGTEI